MTPEGQLKADVVKALNDVLREPEFYLRLNSGKLRVKRGYLHMCPIGTADFLICLKRGMIWVELKAGKTQKDRAEKQLEFRQKVLALGHEHYECWSIDDVLEAIRK